MSHKQWFTKARKEQEPQELPGHREASLPEVNKIWNA